MSEVIEVKEKKKRGRKPKNLEKTPNTEQAAAQPVIEKKKRGRKPKPKSETTEVKIPKKRGRKPLDSNKNIEINKNVNLTEENVILHLPIKTDEINSNNSETLMKYNPKITVPSPFSEDLNFQEVNYSNINKLDCNLNSETNNQNNLHNNINVNDTQIEISVNANANTNLNANANLNDNVNTNLNDIANDNANVNANTNSITNANMNKLEQNINLNDLDQKNKENRDVIEKFENITNKYNNVSLYEKNKVLPILLEYAETNKNKEWPTSVCASCFWCCEQFDSVPIGIPIKKLNNTFYMYGNFCSPECAAAYIFNEKKYMNDCWEKYSMLNLIYGNNQPIKMAPSKICLKKFGGRLTITEFRNICTRLNKSYKVLLPPMVSVLPMIEEININDDSNNIDMFLLNKEQINKANEEYRLRRNKPLPDSKNTLESCMNLKVL